MLGWLLVQFLLGMATNLFVEITRDHPGANPSEYFSGTAQSVTWAVLHGPVLLQVHAALGLLLMAGGVLTLVEALRAGSRGTKMPRASASSRSWAPGSTAGAFSTTTRTSAR
jgi:hypothetical protein